MKATNRDGRASDESFYRDLAVAYKLKTGRRIQRAMAESARIFLESGVLTPIPESASWQGRGNSMPRKLSLGKRCPYTAKKGKK